MAEACLTKVKEQRVLTQGCFLAYIAGSFITGLMAGQCADTGTAIMIGTLTFWLAALKFITLPPLVKVAKSISSRPKRWALISMAVLTVASFDIFIIMCCLIIGIFMLVTGTPELSACASIAVSVPLLWHAHLILRNEDQQYVHVQNCLARIDMPGSFDDTARLVEFCETRDLPHAADCITKNMLYLAEQGYYSQAA